MTQVADTSLVSLFLAVAAGLLSFLSPCVLPLVPVYLGYIAGTSASAIQPNRSRLAAIAPTLAFVVGLAMVFTLLGATATLAGRTFAEYQRLATKIGGLAVIIFGLQLMGVIRIPWLAQTKQANITRFQGRGVLGAALMGAAFATGWVPCVGPFLAGVLTLASQESTAAQGMGLLFAYALGLGIPFVIVGTMWGPALRGSLRWLQPRLGVIELIGGLSLVILGALLFTDQYGFLTSKLTEVFGAGLAI